MREKPRYPAQESEKKRKVFKKEEPIANPERRLFLKLAAKLGATAVVSGGTSYWGFNTLKKWIEGRGSKGAPAFEKEQPVETAEKKELLGEEKVQERKAEDGVPNEETLEEISEDEAQSLREIISFDSKEKVVLDEKTLEKVKNYWRKAYENKLKVDLDRAWRKMGFWEEAARKGFKEGAMKHCALKKMNEKEKEAFWQEFESFFDLAIPESHWDVWANSGVAKGPFQFTLETARDYGLKTGPNYDERTDPEKSARAAASCLLGMHEAMDGDWNLVLSGYNGGFIWKYRKERKAVFGREKKISHQDYMLYLSEEIEKIKKEAHFGKALTHKVKEKDSWKRIAQSYGCQEKELIALNKGIFRKGLMAKQEVVLPETKNLRRLYFHYNVKGFSENINYPAKFLAVKEVLEKRKERKDLPQKEKAPILVIKKRIVQKKGYNRISFAQQDNLGSLALEFNTTVEELIKINKLKNKKIVPGKTLLVPEKKITLLSLAGNNSGLAELLHKLNPAIQEIDRPIPDKLEINMPALTDHLIAKKTDR